MKDKKSDSELSLVRNAMRRLRLMKHPYLLKCIEAGEHAVDSKGNGLLYLITEPVVPLESVLSSLQETPASLAWGTYTLAAAINFLNSDCRIVHAHISLSSIFVDRGMDWKLGGFELLAEADRADEAFYSLCKEVIPKRYQSPELARGNMEALKKLPVAADWWALGCTVFEIFCGQIREPLVGHTPQPSRCASPSPPPPLCTPLDLLAPFPLPLSLALSFPLPARLLPFVAAAISLLSPALPLPSRSSPSL